MRSRLPELPEQKRERFRSEYKLSAYDAGVLTSSRALADFFEQTARVCGSAKSAVNWISRDLLKEQRERGCELEELAITPEILGALIRLVDDGRLTARSARDLLPELVDAGGEPEAMMLERGLEAVQDDGLIEGVVAEVVASHAEAVENVRGGDDKPLNFLMGQVMKATGGKANPTDVRARLLARIRG